MVMTVVSGVVGAVDSVAKEIKINKLEKKLIELKKGKEDGAKLGSNVGWIVTGKQPPRLR